MTQILKALEGYKNLFYQIVGPTAVGTGVARTAISSTYTVPSEAKELLGVIPMITAEAPAPDESVIAVGDIIGPDFKGQPCEWLFPVGSAHLGAIDGCPTTAAEFWPIHAPLKGGEIFNIGVEMCDTLAANGEAMITMVYSTRPSGKRQIYGKFSREVAIGATAAANSGTNLTLSNAIQMYEIVSTIVSAQQVTADEELASSTVMKCSVWDPIQTTSFFNEPIHAIEATTGIAWIQSIQRLPFDARFNNKQATIETIITSHDTMNAATIAVHGVRYYGD